MMARGGYKPRKAGLTVNILPGRESKSCSPKMLLRMLGWTSVAMGVAAVSLYVGRELRSLYIFRRRTPLDFYAHAGDESPAEFGVGT